MAKEIDDYGPQILGATITCTVVALITLITRLYVRVKLIRNVGWDDYMMIATMVLCIAGQCIIIPQVIYGAGRHKQDIPEDDFITAFRLNFVTQPIYLWAICLVKESIGFFLLRVAVKPIYRRTIIGIMAFMAFYTLGCFFTIVLQCTNLAVLWDPSAVGTCWGAVTISALSYTNVSLNILTDLLFSIVIPIPMLWNVQMNHRQKGSVMGILGLGVFATAGALVKVSYLPNYGKEGDWLWDSRNITIWTVVECTVGVIAGNLPCMKPLFRRILGSTYGAGSHKTPGSKYIPHHYGPGGTTKNYNSLASSRTDQDPAYARHGPIETHMMAPVELDERMDGSDGGKGSTENVVFKDDHPFANWGAITKTTEVNVSHTGGGDFDEGMKPERKEPHMV